MKKMILLLIPLIMACNQNVQEQKEKKEENPSQPITTYYFVRHAEKDRTDMTNSDPDLNEKGKERAQKWAEVFKDIPFDLIYSTDFKRTRQTAKPLAKSKGLHISIYDQNKLYSKDFQQKTRGKTVLVVGHSNTNPQFVNAILGEKKYENIPDDENGSLFIVKLIPGGITTSEVLYIN